MPENYSSYGTSKGTAVITRVNGRKEYVKDGNIVRVEENQKVATPFGDKVMTVVVEPTNGKSMGSSSSRLVSTGISSDSGLPDVPKPEVKTNSQVGVYDLEKAQTRKASEFEALATKELQRRRLEEESRMSMEQSNSTQSVQDYARQNVGKKENIYFETTTKTEKTPTQTTTTTSQDVLAMVSGKDLNKDKPTQTDDRGSSDKNRPDYGFGSNNSNNNQSALLSKKEKGTHL